MAKEHRSSKFVLKTKIQEETLRHLSVGWIEVIIVVAAGTAAAQVIERVSVSSAEVEANGDSFAPLYDAVSAYGRFVDFDSTATNHVPDNTTGFKDVFIAYGPATVFADGFETGETSRFSSTVP